MKSDRLPLAGTALLRELDERLGVTEAFAARLEDPREACKVQHSMTEFLQTLARALAAERTAQTAAERLPDDPVVRFAPSDRRGLSPLGGEGQLASQPTFSRALASFATTPTSPC